MWTFLIATLAAVCVIAVLALLWLVACERGVPEGYE